MRSEAWRNRWLWILCKDNWNAVCQVKSIKWNKIEIQSDNQTRTSVPGWRWCSSSCDLSKSFFKTAVWWHYFLDCSLQGQQWTLKCLWYSGSHLARKSCCCCCCRGNTLMYYSLQFPTLTFTLAQQEAFKWMWNDKMLKYSIRHLGMRVWLEINLWWHFATLEWIIYIKGDAACLQSSFTYDEMADFGKPL